MKISGAELIAGYCMYNERLTFPEADSSVKLSITEVRAFKTYGGMLFKEAKSYAAKNPSDLIVVILAVDLTNSASLGII